jgi:hypothetical protein
LDAFFDGVVFQHQESEKQQEVVEYNGAICMQFITSSSPIVFVHILIG